MGLVMGRVYFPGQVPSLEELAARVTARSGLLTRAEPSDLGDGFYQVHGQLAFACVPELWVEVYCYSPEQRQRNVEMFIDSGLVSPDARHAPRPPGATVHVQTFVGVEPTLFFQTELALEELGGELGESFPEEARSEYGQPLTEAELLRRVRDAQVAMRPVVWASALLMPLLLPLHIAWTLVRLPWMLWKARRLLRERGGFPFRLSDHEDISEGIRLPPRRPQPPSQDPS
jgi:hypothetical protein